MSECFLALLLRLGCSIPCKFHCHPQLNFYRIFNKFKCSTFIDFHYNKILAKTMICSRLLFLAGVAVLIAGGSLQGSDDLDDQKTGTKLVRIGYCIVTVFVGFLLALQIFFWSRKSQLNRTSLMVRLSFFRDSREQILTIVSNPGTSQRVLGHAVLHRSPELRFPFHIPPRSNMEPVDWTGCTVHCDGIVDGVLRCSYLFVHWI